MKKLEKPVDPFDRRRKRLPWEVMDNAGVNPELRTYTFMLKEGCVGTADERFIHILNTDMKTSTAQRLQGPNTCNIPVDCKKMTYAEVNLLYQICANDDLPLRIGFGKMRKNTLTHDELVMLANAGDHWVFAPRGAAGEKVAEVKKSADDFLKSLDEPVPSVPNPNPPIQDNRKSKLQTAGI